MQNQMDRWMEATKVPAQQRWQESTHKTTNPHKANHTRHILVNRRHHGDGSSYKMSVLEELCELLGGGLV